MTDQQDDWIKTQVEGGHYTNDSEYIRDLIRRAQERGAEIEAIRAALIQGEKNGKPKRFNAGAFRAAPRASRGRFPMACNSYPGYRSRQAPTADSIANRVQNFEIDFNVDYHTVG